MVDWLVGSTDKAHWVYGGMYYIGVFLRENHRKLRMARSTNATEDWTWHLPSASSSAEPTQPLRLRFMSPKQQGSLKVNVLVIMITVSMIRINEWKKKKEWKTLIYATEGSDFPYLTVYLMISFVNRSHTINEYPGNHTVKIIKLQSEVR